MTLSYRVECILGDLHDQLVASHGWTEMDITVSENMASHSLQLRGTVLLDAVRRRVIEVVREAMPPTWVLEQNLRIRRIRQWVALAAPLATVWEKIGPQGTCEPLATELATTDGPVGLLVELPRVALIRCGDGTVGWINRSSLGALTSPPAIRACWPDWGELEKIARSYLGTPYKRGGTTSEGIDCSGLIQRIYGRACGVVMPRYSDDQLAIGAEAEAGILLIGDLVYGIAADGSNHGAIVANGGFGVVHASTSRALVIGESLEHYRKRAGGHLAIVRRQSLLDFHASNRGKTFARLPNEHPGDRAGAEHGDCELS